MFKRIVKTAGIILAICCVSPAQASPIGFYFKPAGSLYWGKKSSKKENFVGSVGAAYQFNRTRSWELNIALITSIPENITNPLDSNRKNVLYAATFINKDLIPLKYYLNLYTQWGFSVKSELGLHAPFWGAGVAWYYNRWVHFDLGLRNYSLLGRSSSDTGYPNSRDNSFILGVGFYVR